MLGRVGRCRRGGRERRGSGTGEWEGNAERGQGGGAVQGRSMEGEQYMEGERSSAGVGEEELVFLHVKFMRYDDVARQMFLFIRECLPPLVAFVLKSQLFF